MTVVSTRACFVSLFTLLLGGCHHRTASRVSSFSVADPSAARQLVSGFYEVENGSRWTGPEFTFALPPPGGPPRPAKVAISIYFPPSEIERLGPITITATGSEYQFGKATYDKAGPQEFVVEIPAAAFCTNVVPVTFSLDKYLHGANSDLRDLGVIVNRISLRN